MLNLFFPQVAMRADTIGIFRQRIVWDRRLKSRCRLLVFGLAHFSACATPTEPPLPTPRPSTPPVRDYWPTDDWHTADPADVGLDPALRAELDATVARDLPFLDSLSIVKDGYLAYKRYFKEATAVSRPSGVCRYQDRSGAFSHGGS